MEFCENIMSKGASAIRVQENWWK